MMDFPDWLPVVLPDDCVWKETDHNVSPKGVHVRKIHKIKTINLKAIWNHGSELVAELLDYLVSVLFFWLTFVAQTPSQDLSPQPPTPQKNTSFSLFWLSCLTLQVPSLTRANVHAGGLHHKRGNPKKSNEKSLKLNV